MLSHPDRVRGNYADVAPLRWKTLEEEPILQTALDIVNGNWDAWQREVEFETLDTVPRADVVELIARIITDIQTHGHRRS